MTSGRIRSARRPVVINRTVVGTITVTSVTIRVNTIPPSDFGFFEVLNELVQDEPSDSNTNIELMGDLAAIGIVKGKPFKPDKRMRGILEAAAAVGSATSRALVFRSARVGRVRVLRRVGVGIAALGRRIQLRDSASARHQGAKSYRVTLPADIPGARFWSLTLYDNETRSMLQTPQRFPGAGSQSYPTPAATADADGTTTVVFGPERPADTPEGNWIQTDEDKGFFAILRCYSPLESYFDTSWRPSEIEAVSTNP